MDPRILAATYRLQHSHGDGSWAEMVEDRNHHSPADHDPERSWGTGRLFRCVGCDESVTIQIDPEEVTGPAH